MLFLKSLLREVLGFAFHKAFPENCVYWKVSVGLKSLALVGTYVKESYFSRAFV